MDHKSHGRFRAGDLTKHVSGILLGSAINPLTKESLTHIDELCKSRGLERLSYFRWWLETNCRAPMYRNVIMSPKTDRAFLTWVDGQRAEAAFVVKMQLEELKVTIGTSYVSPEKLFSRSIRGVDPLVHFTLGGYLGYPESVKWIEAEALDELVSKPWIAEQLVKFKDNLPEIK